DDVVVAVPAPDGLEAVELEVFEQAPVEGRDLLAAVKRFAGPAGDVVLGVLGESRHDRRDVAVLLGSEMRIDHGVDLPRGDAAGGAHALLLEGWVVGANAAGGSSRVYQGPTTLPRPLYLVKSLISLSA